MKAEEETPMLNNSQAARYCGFKDNEAFRAWRMRHKVPCEVRGKGIFFHKDVLNHVLIKLQTQKTYA